MICIQSVGIVKEYTLQITVLLDKKTPNLFKLITQKYILNYLIFSKDFFWYKIYEKN